MTVTYQQALRAFDAGLGTLVRSVEHEHIALALPPIAQAPEIRQPAAGASRYGVVAAHELTRNPLQGLQGAVKGKGVVFWSAANAGPGSWQPVKCDGTGAILFGKTTEAQFDALSAKLDALCRQENGHLSVAGVDEILRYADAIGIRDRYRSTVDFVGDARCFRAVASARFPNDAALMRLIERPVDTQALMVPAGEALLWNPDGAPGTQPDRHGSLLVVSRTTPLELRPLEPAEAQAFYRMAGSAEPIRLGAFNGQGVARLCEEDLPAVIRNAGPVRQSRSVCGVALATHVGLRQLPATVQSTIDGRPAAVRISVPTGFKQISQDRHVVEPVSLPCPRRWIEYVFGEMRTAAAGLPGGAMVTMASVQDRKITLGHVGDTGAVALVQDARSGKVTARRLTPDQSIDDLATLLKAFFRNRHVEQRLGAAAHLDLTTGEVFPVEDRTIRHINGGMSTPHSIGGYADNDIRRHGQNPCPHIQAFDVDALKRNEGDRVFLWLLSDGLVDVHPRKTLQNPKSFIAYERYARLLESLLEEGREEEFSSRAVELALAERSTDDKTSLMTEVGSRDCEPRVMAVIDGHGGHLVAEAIAYAIEAQAGAVRAQLLEPPWAHGFAADKPNPAYVSPYSHAGSG
jgi:serine/threonine protein phosphatase PrpC